MAKLIKKTPQQEIAFLPNARRMALIAQKFRAKNIEAYDVRELTVLADAFLLCSVTSDPQLKAVYNGVREGMKEIGLIPLHAEGEISSNWLLLDYGDIIFHIFRERAYEFYDLGGLWGDAPILDLDLDEE